MHRFLFALIVALTLSSSFLGCGGHGSSGGGGGGSGGGGGGGGAPPTWTTQTTLIRGFLGQADSRLLSVSGGTAPYTITLSAGSLPNGINLSTQTTGAALNGTPSLDGQYNFALTVLDATAKTATQSFSWRISDPIAIDATVPTATHGSPYTTTLTATGGVGGPYVNWQVTSGTTLPTGLTLTTSGTLSGMVSAAGSFTFVVSCSDSGTDTNTGAKSITLTVQ